MPIKSAKPEHDEKGSFRMGINKITIPVVTCPDIIGIRNPSRCKTGSRKGCGVVDPDFRRDGILFYRAKPEHDER
jgi:hypothetical protein